MNCGQASQVIGGLSNPGKMPGRAFGFSATKCITGSKLRNVPGSVCSDCYALKGMYIFTPVKKAHARRYRALTAALVPGPKRDRWLRAITKLVARQEWFRWHDSGDLQSVDHLRLIAEVCRRTPNTRHWLPTREYKLLSDYRAAGETVPANLTVRLSAHMKNQVIPEVAVPEGMTASAVWTNHSEAPGYRCPSRQQGNKCGDCRACWSRDVKLVTYENH